MNASSISADESCQSDLLMPGDVPQEGHPLARAIFF
jgi:hypothetical protein